ncbi:MAG: hypothetical protein LUE87_04525 [Lachnospiraceae bacterium]|nr:hypothetical protein [Lachnospiraceae bacterium]
MVKTYITAISLQGRGDLEKGVYQPEGFTLEHNRAVSFPIIPVIAEYSPEGNHARVIAIRAENQDTRDNYDAFLEQLSEIGVTKEQVTVISVREDQGRNVGLTTLMKILDAIEDDSIVYAVITFGTKPMAMYILYAAIFVEKLKDAEVDGIYYGEVPRVASKIDWNRAKLYDLTVLKTLGDVIEEMKNLEITDIRGTLQKLIDM